LTSIADGTLWGATLAVFAVLIVVDLVLTRRPHAVGMREAAAWSAFYIALPLAFAGWVWAAHGQEPGIQFLTGYVVEKSLSADNLFVFLLLLGAFAVPAELRQRVLLYGIVGALALRAVLIALGAAALEAFSFTFLAFGLILAITAVKVFLDARRGHTGPANPGQLRSVRLLRRFVPVTEDYDGSRLVTRAAGRRVLTPLAVAVIAVLGADVVFAVDSVPAVFGITEDPYLVFATNAFALLGLRALYFLLAGALGRLVHLGYGLAVILGVIGLKLVLHWAHGIWPAVPEVPTLLGLALIIGVLVIVTITSLRVDTGSDARSALASRGAGREDQHIHRSTAPR
jgi:tellurite resistance protein TerC